ncbi:DUF1641 domain-containing protein [Gemmatimonadota bacterium]
MSENMSPAEGSGSEMTELTGKTPDEILEICTKLDRAVVVLDELKRQREMLSELKEDLMPMANGMISITSEKLQELERNGTLDFIREGVKMTEQVTSAFTPEDVRLLGDNIVHILMTVRNFTQPEILGLADRASLALKEQTHPKSVGAFGLLKALRDPEVKKGTGVLIELLRSLGRESEPTA